ncbi:MAG: endonuclease V [Candidatus Atribacteria bacterium]|nr:endonuclease V [Candidatus Atribacteria bacterium]
MLSKKMDCPYTVTVSEAVSVQKHLRENLSFQFPYVEEEVHTVAGIDVSYFNKRTAWAVVVVLDYPSLELQQVVWATAEAVFPYVPGFLSFREGPAVEAALMKLPVVPQIFFFDGQGIAHPRGVGLASHFGVLFDIVSVGVAKSLLVGSFVEPPLLPGSYSYLEYHGQKVGAAIRTRAGVKPVFVSPGHRIDVEGAIHWTLRVTGKYRIPVPTRLAHIYSEKLKSQPPA